jgi:beta-lactamase class A
MFSNYNGKFNKPLAYLASSNSKYAFYFAPTGTEPFFQSNHERFSSASLIKVPILLAWIFLERAGEVNRDEFCVPDAETQVQGAGFSWLLKSRRLPYQDVLLMMIALSDNLCANLVIRRIGLKRLNRVFHEILGLPGTELQRKLMDFEARSRGLDNWITAQDCVRLFQLIEELASEERAWVDSLLGACQENLFFLRDIPVDTLTDEREFHHKSGSFPGVLHDWGYNNRGRIFLLTQNVKDDRAMYQVFGELGQLLL